MANNSFSATVTQVVLGFDPTEFSVSDFTAGNLYTTTPTITTNGSAGSGIYDFGMSDSVSRSAGTYTLFTFTLTALSNAPVGTSNLYTLVNDGSTFTTEIKNASGVPNSGIFGTGNTYNSSYDLQVDVTASSAPEPASLGLVVLAAASLLAYRRKRNTL